MGTRPNYVYVASSWRNPVHADVIDALAVAGIDHYDFKNPSGGTGFSWREVMELERVSHDFVPYRANPTICSVCGSVQPMPCLSLPAALTATAGVPAKGADWVPARRYLDMVSHRRAIEGFEADFLAMRRADACVMVLPCGKSAHLELGWAVGAGKRTIVLLEDPVEPELMYRMVDHFATSIAEVLAWLGVE